MGRKYGARRPVRPWASWTVATPNCPRRWSKAGSGRGTFLTAMVGIRKWVLVLLAGWLVGPVVRDFPNRGRKAIETRGIVGQQPGVRAFVGCNQRQKPEERFIGRRLCEIDVRPVSAPYDSLGGDLCEGLRKGDGGLQRALFRKPVRAAEIDPT